MLPNPKTQAKPHEHKTQQSYLVKTDEALGIVEAVVNVFGILDLGKDVITNGAYTKTLNERGNKVRVKVLDSHNTDSVMRVVGKVEEIREIGRDELAMIAPDVLRDHPKATGGLFTRTQYLLDTPEGLGVFKRIAAGAVNEYSIALDALDTEYGAYQTEDGKTITGVRFIKALRLWEFSPVVFGMNQATVTTDVKSGAGAEEAKRGSLAAKLEANMRMGYAYCVNDWLSYGLIDGDMITLLDGALTVGMGAFRSAIPQEIAGMEIEYYSAEGGAETKAGRVLSASNRTKIVSAIEALQAVLDADQPAETEDDEDKSEKAQAAPQGSVEAPQGSSVTGPDGADGSLPAEPSITDAAIERELADLAILEEMVGP